MTDVTTPTIEELTGRLAEATSRHDGRLPADHAAAWSGYIAALLEWGLLTPADHGRLQDQLPPSAAAAALPIFLGSDVPVATAATSKSAPARVAG